MEPTCPFHHSIGPGPHGPKWWRRVLSRADVVVARLGPKDAALLMNALAREHYVDAMFLRRFQPEVRRRAPKAAGFRITVAFAVQSQERSEHFLKFHELVPQ